MSDLNTDLPAKSAKSAKPFAMDVRKKAASAAHAFDAIALLTAVLGGFATVLTFISVLVASSDDSGYGDQATNGMGLMFAVVLLVSTVLSWASLTLAAVIAGYIAQRS